MGESNKALFGRIIDVIDDVMKSSTGSAGIVPRSAIDQLADVGRAEAAYAAYERGLLDGARLRDGAVSADALARELNDDPV